MLPLYNPSRSFTCWSPPGILAFLLFMFVSPAMAMDTELYSPQIGTANLPTGKTKIWLGEITYTVVNGVAVAEGDIVLGPAGGITAQGTGVVGTYSIWPGGVVPYSIDPKLPTPSRVTDAIAVWNTKLAGYIHLIPRTAETAYVNFVPGSGCSSYVGYVHSAAEPITLDTSCSTGNAIHEIGHVLGLWHEQTRNDRDTYILVHTANIDPAYAFNFSKVGASGQSIGAYDYGSIMHYGSTAFSINGQPTITTIPAGIPIGQRSGLSAGDIAAIQFLYNTGGSPPPPPPPSPVALPDPDLSGMNGRAFTNQDVISLTYPVPVTEFIWSLSPTLADASPARTMNAPASGVSSYVTASPRLNLGIFTLDAGTYLVTVQAKSAGAISNPASAEITLINTSFTGTIQGIKAYPNPWRSDKDSTAQGISFSGVPSGATVKIFTTSGYLVKELSGGTTAAWDLTNKSNNTVASGIYLYLVTDGQGNKTRGKVAVIR
jgi:hypothetical protein